MAILADPLFSDEARGTVAQLITYKRSKVHPVLCAFTDHPVNWTPAKIAQAKYWKLLCNSWRSLSYSDQALWRSIAPGVLTGFNYFMHLKGEIPLLPCYDPPSGDLLLYDFSLFPYDPPVGNSLSFIWEPCI